MFSLYACSQGRQTVPVKAVDDYAAKVHSGDLAAGAEPFDTYAKSNEVFGAWVSREFTPVQIVVENRATEKFLVQRSRARLLCETVRASNP